MNIQHILLIAAAAMGPYGLTLAPRAEGAVKYTTNVVGSSVKSTAPKNVDDACSTLVADKTTPVDVLNFCASGRPGWLKF